MFCIVKYFTEQKMNKRWREHTLLECPCVAHYIPFCPLSHPCAATDSVRAGAAVGSRLVTYSCEWAATEGNFPLSSGRGTTGKSCGNNFSRQKIKSHLGILLLLLLFYFSCPECYYFRWNARNVSPVNYINQKTVCIPDWRCEASGTYLRRCWMGEIAPVKRKHVAKI